MDKFVLRSSRNFAQINEPNSSSTPVNSLVEDITSGCSPATVGRHPWPSGWLHQERSLEGLGVNEAPSIRTPIRRNACKATNDSKQCSLHIYTSLFTANQIPSPLTDLLLLVVLYNSTATRGENTARPRAATSTSTSISIIFYSYY
jgi:hypothetical protein